MRTRFLARISAQGRIRDAVVGLQSFPSLLGAPQLPSSSAIARQVCHLPRSRRIRAYPRTVGDCPDFAQSSEQNGTVPLSETVPG